MSIISGFETVKEYIKKSDGYKAISRWTSSHTVEMDSGNTLEEEISTIGKGVELTQEEYNNLTEEEKNNDTIYYIKDGDTSLPVVLLTKSEYDDIGDSVNDDGKIYLVTDDDYNTSSKDVFYDNTNSELESTNVQDAIDELFDKIYPVGSIYMSVSDTNPTELFGGIWEAWGAGRVPIGVNASDNDFKTAEKTGGSKAQSLFAAIGAYDNSSNKIGYAITGVIKNLAYSYGGTLTNPESSIAASRINHSIGVFQQNGNNATTIQPYITCYMFKRTA